MQDKKPSSPLDRERLRADLQKAGTGLLAMVKLPATVAPLAPALKKLAGDSLSQTCDAIVALPDDVLAPVLWWLDRELFAVQGRGTWLEDPAAFKTEDVRRAFDELRRAIVDA